MFTEEDACENGWLAVILWIIRHHCVTKIGFDVSYGYMCSYGYSATTAIFDKRRINKFSIPLPVTVPVCLPKLIPTKGQQQEAIILFLAERRDLW